MSDFLWGCCGACGVEHFAHLRLRLSDEALDLTPWTRVVPKDVRLIWKLGDGEIQDILKHHLGEEYRPEPWHALLQYGRQGDSLWLAESGLIMAELPALIPPEEVVLVRDGVSFGLLSEALSFRDRWSYREGK